ncbi:MAG TPA: 3D domain-containing protein [Abditibacteriaceae bacterium]
MWTIVLCLVFPVGFQTGFQTSGRADSNTTAVSAAATSAANSATPVATDDVQSLPANDAPSVPDANSAAFPAQDAPAQVSPEIAVPFISIPGVTTQRIHLTAVVSGVKRSGTVTVPRSGATVGNALKALNISLGSLDRVSPLANKPAFNGMTVRIQRVRADVKKRFVTVPSETRYRPSAELRSGTKQIIQRGNTGLVEITERIWSLDGKTSNRERVSQKVVRRAENTVVALGTRSYYMPGRVPYHNRYATAYRLAARSGSPRDRMMAEIPTSAAPAPDGKTYRAVRSITLVATGYSPDPSENGGYTVTATGLPIGYGAAAVDPRVIPLGTKLYVEGYGYAFACDVGGAIKGKRIDLAYDSYRYANTKGRKKVRAWILAP